VKIEMNNKFPRMFLLLALGCLLVSIAAAQAIFTFGLPSH